MRVDIDDEIHFRLQWACIAWKCPNESVGSYPQSDTKYMVFWTTPHPPNSKTDYIYIASQIVRGTAVFQIHWQKHELTLRVLSQNNNPGLRLSLCSAIDERDICLQALKTAIINSGMARDYQEPRGNASSLFAKLP